MQYLFFSLIFLQAVSASFQPSNRLLCSLNPITTMICDMLDSLALGNSSVKTAGKLEIAGSRSRSKAGSLARL